MDKEKTGTPDYGSGTGYRGSAPQSGMVQDEEKDDKTPVRPPTGNGSQSGSAPESTDAATTDENPNANR